MNTQPWRRQSALLWIVLLTAGMHAGSNAESAPAEAANEPSMAAVAKDCKRCHQGEQSLNEVSDAELTAMLLAMVSGEMDHPTELPALSEQQIAELLRVLKPR